MKLLGKIFLVLFNLAGIAAALILFGEFLTIKDYNRYYNISRKGVQEFFTPKGNRYEILHPFMVKQSFDIKKPDNEYRIFVLGYSQAMGSPYVHQNNDHISSFFNLIVMPNEGGICTWLQQYLDGIVPGKKVNVINTAMAQSGLEDQMPLFEEILKNGNPDLLIILSHARAVPPIKRQEIEKQLIKEIVYKSEKTGIKTYMLTVPSNLSGWIPEKNGRSFYEKAASYKDSGEYAKAREYYIKAKDADDLYRRPPSEWNNRIRRIQSTRVKPLDMETILYSYSKNGIPGTELFHDYIHFNYAANRIVAREIAEYFAKENNLPSQALSDIRSKKIKEYDRFKLATLYYLQAVKWLRHSYKSDDKESRNSNTRNTARSYADTTLEYKEIKRLIKLIESIN